MIVHQETEYRSVQRGRAPSSVRKDHRLLHVVAVLLLLFLLGSVTWLISSILIEQTSILGQETQQTKMEHVDGILLHITADRSFTLKTETGQILYFVCDNTCHASLPHLQRHERERAQTDVYYTFEAAGDHLFHARYVD